MSVPRFAAITLLLTLAAGSLAAQSGRPWPPPVQPISATAAPRTPAAELDTFSVPPGYRVELVASEPLVQDPIVMEFDADGRLWVIEMPGFMPELNPSNERERQPDGRVVVLEDKDDDGRMDTRRVFMDGLVLPRAMKVLSDGVLIAEPPNLWYVSRDADLNAGRKELVTDTYGTRNAGIEHNENSLLWGFDNWLHTSEGTTAIRLKNRKFEVRRTLSRGQWGATHDDAGRIYRNTNESVLHVDLVPTSYYGRNPNLLRTRGSYESLAGADREVNRVWPAHTTPGVNRGYQTGVLREDGRLANFTSVGAPVVFRGDRLPADVYGNVFVAEPAANLVSRIILEDNDGDVTARKAYDQAEFMTSVDERFRPVYLSAGPDGTLYVLDMYRGVIQHRDYVTEYLRDQFLARGLVLPTGYGRVFRIVHDSTPRGGKPALSTASSARLVELLSHPNGWWRDTAQRLLVERADVSVAPSLMKIAASSGDFRPRLHALWILDGIDRIDPDVVRRALSDPSVEIRIAALRLSERWLVEPDHPIASAVLERMKDQSPAVRRQLAATLGQLPAERRDAALAGLLDQDGADPVVVDAALSGMRGSEAIVLERMLQPRERTPQREAAIAMLSATIVRSADDPAIQQVFGWAADAARPEWQRSAALLGVEVAWLGARAPGTPAPRPPVATAAAAPPCPTCPGGRAGPGGASAFGRSGGGGGRGGGPGIRVAREPAALSALAGRDGDLGRRASLLLARLEWPGKPGVAAPVAPLTAVEEGRFVAGREVFASACAACHQTDGRGKDAIAPTLVGAPLVLGPADLTTRVLLNGKEGAVGLMPPLGQAFSDEQIASVLTYIRRQWGNTASPVDPASVRSTRTLVADRTRPWSSDELLRMLDAAPRQESQ